MKANELRIGNWVQTNDGRQYQISLSWYECCRNTSEGRDIQLDTHQIPLTEEWLIRFGFKIKTKSFTKNSISIKQQTKGCFFYHTGIMIKHIHQLQNLYFALTGKELEII